MKIACICITKGGNRANVFGIAAASYTVQVYNNACLFINAPRFNRGNEKQFRQVLNRCGTWGSISVTYEENVPWRLHTQCEKAFGLGADLCAIWDDDDYHPPTQLQRMASVFKAMPNATGVVGYRQGFFCNLRTLQGHEVANEDGAPWGATLVFNKAAFIETGGFADRKCPGYDRAFVADVKKAGLGVVKIEDTVTPPVAFSHGDNVATWLMHPGRDLSHMLKRAPILVQQEIARAREWLIERHIYPPQTPPE